MFTLRLACESARVPKSMAMRLQLRSSAALLSAPLRAQLRSSAALLSAPLRTWGRHESTLRLLQPRAAGASDAKPTVYCTGFLTDTSGDDNFRDWLSCHIALSDGASLGWCAEAHGVEWRTGHTGDFFGRWPLLLHSSVFLLRRSSPLMLVGGVAGDGLLNAARVYYAFNAAEDAAKQDAPSLAAALSSLHARPQSESYRVVAHSLGCRLVLEALPLLPRSERPAEVHLCAAAITAEAALSKLPYACRPGGRLYHHYSTGDEALSSAFKLASRGKPALGSGPLSAEATSHCAAAAEATTTLSSHDASSYLGLFTHGQFRSHFHRLAADGARALLLPMPSTAAQHVLYASEESHACVGFLSSTVSLRLLLSTLHARVCLPLRVCVCGQRSAARLHHHRSRCSRRSENGWVQSSEPGSSACRR